MTPVPRMKTKKAQSSLQTVLDDVRGTPEGRTGSGDEREPERPSITNHPPVQRKRNRKRREHRAERQHVPPLRL